MRGRLLVISHVTHYFHAGRLYAFGPYAREIDIWADLFDQIVIAAPCRSEPPPGDNVPLNRPNISMAPQLETGGHSVAAKFRQVVALPWLALSLSQAILAADVVHVRCPGNLGLLGALLVPLFRRRHIAKYAGEWTGYRGEPQTVRWQRTILASRWWRNGIVTVYGNPPGQPCHVVPFFTSMMTDKQVQAASVIAFRKRLESPAHLLFAGRLDPAKHVDHLIRAVGILKERRVAFRLSIIGDGPERVALERLVQAKRLCEEVEFTGALPYDEMMEWYGRAHLLVLPSSHEGWPKVLAEAMCHGLVCISTDLGFARDMLGEGKGRLYPLGNIEALAACLEHTLADADGYLSVSRAGAAWASRHSIEGLRDALRELVTRLQNDRRARIPAAIPEKET